VILTAAIDESMKGGTNGAIEGSSAPTTDGGAASAMSTKEHCSTRRRMSAGGTDTGA